MSASQKYTSLDFDGLVNQLSGYAGSDLTRQLISEIEIVFHPARIDENLDQTGEAYQFLIENPSVGLPPFSVMQDMSDLWQRIVAGELVDSQQAKLILNFLQVCKVFDSFRTHLPMEDYPRINDVAAAWQPQTQLLSLTKRIFNEDGEVRDSASTELQRIREKLRKFEGDAGRGVRELLRGVKQATGEDAHLALRNNRFVILMPRSMSGEVKGNVVDISGSGQSIYFEPESVSSLNTERQHLFLEEDQEIRKILRDYGIQVAGHIEPLKANLSILVKLDYIFARARYAIALNANRPRMSNLHGFKLRNAVHPLLFRDFVPETVVFDEQKALVISGVNAGGKTVLLKLLGLYSLMAALGCYVPGDAQLPYLSGLHADIGDEQSTTQNLSTFTAHLKFITRLWDDLGKVSPADDPWLVLIDEIGTGTEPGEGAAFAYGLISRLLAFPVKLAVTTHYDVLKTMAYEREDVKNACLEFDEDNLQPTYRVLDNQPGKSFALAIARRWGVDKDILSIAAEAIGKDESKIAGIIGELEKQRKKADSVASNMKRQSEELTKVKSENEELALELRRQKDNFALQAEKVKVELERKIDELLSETKQKLKRKARQVTRKQDEYVKAASKTAAVVKRQKDIVEEAVEEILETMAINSADVETVDGVIEVGMTAVIVDSNVSGKVIEIDTRKKEAVLEVMGKRLAAKLNRLKPTAGGSTKPPDPLEVFRRATGVHDKLDYSFTNPVAKTDSIDLHGLTVEEAREALDNYMSRSLEHNIATIHVMHGVGTGRLKAFVWDYLTHCEHVSDVRQAVAREGGVGVTIAELK